VNAIQNRLAPQSRCFASVARSHIGNVRTINEDRVLDFPERQFWAVADGMGGHSLGDVAATTVIRALQEAIASGPAPDTASIQAMIDRVNATMLADATRAGHLSGSTVGGLSIVGDRALAFWVGDSRIYRLRRGALTQVSRDHRLVQDLIDARLLDEDAARNHPQANVITRAIGTHSSVRADFVEVIMEAGDRFLLCTDGLSDLMPARQIAAALALPIERAALMLLQGALSAGGNDNISLIIVTETDGRPVERATFHDATRSGASAMGTSHK
jgi:serine/threonine protein phosphatase PrpC